MANTDYWQRQSKDKPLFPDLLWSRPENKSFAGKLFIAGGSDHGFAAPAEAFAAAERAGIGSARVLLPDSLQKTVGKVFEAGEFAPSTPSGSFATRAVAKFTELAAWSDATLLTGDFGRNSETAILFENFTNKYTGLLAMAQDAVDYAIPGAVSLLNRKDLLLALTFSQLQKLAISARYPKAFTSTMDFLHLVEALHDFTTVYPAVVLLHHDANIYIASSGKVSTTQGVNSNLVTLAATGATWWLQNLAKPYEAVTTSLVNL